MAESSEPGRRAAAGGGSLDEEEDEEREPLLPRIAWAEPRKGAPGTAVRLVEAAREEGAGSPGETGDKELLLRPKDAPRCPCRGVGCLRSSSTDLDWSSPACSGATRLFPCPRGPLRAPVTAAGAQPRIHALPRVPAPGSRPVPSSSSILSHASSCLIAKAILQASRPEHRPRGRLLVKP